MTEETINQKYIKISYSKFFKGPFSRSSDSYLRSIEAYLIRNNRKYNIEGEECIIYVNDKEDAMSLGFHFNFRRIMYFDGIELLPVMLVAKDRKEGPEREMTDNNTGERMTTLKRLREQPYEEAKRHCLEKKEIIKRGILSNKELKKAVEGNKLIEICILKRSYFDRQELADFIKKIASNGLNI